MSSIFVVTLQGQETPQGRALTVLAFVAARDEAAARTAAEAELARFGWTDVEALRVGEITARDALPADFADALAVAERYGCGLIIYDEP